MKKCRICKSPYEPHNSLQRACGPACALALVKLDNERKAAKVVKESRAWVKQQKERLKTRGEHTKEAQQAFNAYIRARDANQCCVSCGSWPDNSGLTTGSRIDAGHYRSVGACPELRFEEMNCWSQCVKCNQHLSGNAVEYRNRLKIRIGEKALAWLEGPHDPKRYTIDELKEIKAKYRRLTREIQKERMAA